MAAPTRAGVSHNAPYKHFPDKEALLAAVAARELNRRSSSLSAITAARQSPGAGVQAVMRGYIAWAVEFPQRFKLVYGSWSEGSGSGELADAAGAARSLMVGIVAEAQRAGQLPAANPERLASLLPALTHGAADLVLAGHLSPSGKGRASPDDLADGLFGYLQAAAGEYRTRGSGDRAVSHTGRRPESRRTPS